MIATVDFPDPWPIKRNGKRTGKWRVRYTIPELMRREIPRHLWIKTGKKAGEPAERVSKDFPNYELAHAFIRQEERLFRLGLWTHPDARQTEEADERITVGQWLKRHQEQLQNRPQPLATNTLVSYQLAYENRITKPVKSGADDAELCQLADTPIRSATRKDINQWWQAVRRIYPNESAANAAAYNRLNRAFKEAVRQEVIPSNPVDVPSWERTTKPKDLPAPETADLVKVLDAMKPEHKMVTSLILFHGLRLGEALAVEKKHVIITESDNPNEPPRIVVQVRQSLKNVRKRGDDPAHIEVGAVKTGAGERDVPIYPNHAHLFIDHLRSHTPRRTVAVRTQTGQQKCHLLTVREDGQAMGGNQYRTMLSRIEKRIDVSQSVRPHSGRRWATTELAALNATPREVGAILGQVHVPTVVNTYLKARPERLAELSENLSTTLGVTV